LRGDYGKVQKGDCIVAFSKADLFSIKAEIERRTPHKCCLVYGQLPPETRSTQARLFNDENSGFDVLVASDAIGMGLNLNIRRVIFHTTLKMGSDKRRESRWLLPTFVKQIGGRAGRLSSKYEYYTSWAIA
jgi:ATP-dependent RNA helicase SUPV3L1/SUV3